jgi:hypothetical protein
MDNNLEEELWVHGGEAGHPGSELLLYSCLDGTAAEED